MLRNCQTPDVTRVLAFLDLHKSEYGTFIGNKVFFVCFISFHSVISGYKPKL